MNEETEAIRRLAHILRSVPRTMALPQLAALLAVADEPGLSVNDLAERIDAPQQSASRYASVLLGRYQEAGADAPPVALVEQRVSESDPRRRALFLTAQGQDLIASLVEAGWGANPEETNQEERHVGRG